MLFALFEGGKLASFEIEANHNTTHFFKDTVRKPMDENSRRTSKRKIFENLHMNYLAALWDVFPLKLNLFSSAEPGKLAEKLEEARS
jgi:hypothetical protein